MFVSSSSIKLSPEQWTNRNKDSAKETRQIIEWHAKNSTSISSKFNLSTMFSVTTFSHILILKVQMVEVLI
jgi:hypothetical protein